MAAKLGIIAGGGDLPKRIVQRCRDTDRPFFVLAFEGQTDPATVQDTDHGWVRLGAVGKALSFFHGAQVKELVMAGPLRRPAWSEIRPDALGMKWLTRLMKAKGDDSMFRIIMEQIENEGFIVIGADDVIGDEIMACAGIMGQHKPDVQAQADIKYALEIAQALGQVDVGQSVIVQQGMVLGVEAVEGTNALIERCKELQRPGVPPVLVKIAKPGQERRVDLPTIGPDTINNAAAANIGGIAVQTGEVQILHRDEVIALADKLGLFLVGVNA